MRLLTKLPCPQLNFCLNFPVSTKTNTKTNKPKVIRIEILVGIVQRIRIESYGLYNPTNKLKLANIFITL